MSKHSYRLIWFQHFHKAAGTSIVELARLNGERLWPQHANGNPLDDSGSAIPLWRYRPAALGQFVDRCEGLGVTFVATEWGLPLLGPLRQDPRVTLITCLRRPLDRLVSNFHFDVHYGYTSTDNLDAYVASGEGVHTMFDYYTRILSRHDADPRPVDRVQFDRAFRALSRFHHRALLETGLDPLIAALGWRPLLDTPCNSGRLTATRLQTIMRQRRWRHLVRMLSRPRRRPPADFVARFATESPWDLRLYAHLAAQTDLIG